MRAVWVREGIRPGARGPARDALQVTTQPYRATRRRRLDYALSDAVSAGLVMVGQVEGHFIIVVGEQPRERDSCASTTPTRFSAVCSLSGF